MFKTLFEKYVGNMLVIYRLLNLKENLILQYSTVCNKLVMEMQ